MYPQVNFTDTQAGVVGLILAAVTMVNWWFAMFSDHWYGDLGRSFGEGEFNVGRNTVALTLPAVGLFCLFGGAGLLFDHRFGQPELHRLGWFVFQGGVFRWDGGGGVVVSGH